MNSHEQYAALLDAFIDGALQEPEAERVRAHLALCPECQEYVSDALTMRELFPGVEETPVPDGFAEAVLSGLPPQHPAQNGLCRTLSRNSRTQWRNGQRRTQWTKIALPLAACVTLALLVGGVLRGLPVRDGMTQNATLTAAGYEAPEESVPDTDGGGVESASDMDEATEESASDMDGGGMPESVTDGGAASGDHTNTSGAALKRAYQPPETPEADESAVFDFGMTAPTLYNDSADFPETPALGASYDAVTDSADAAPPENQAADSADAMPSQVAEDMEDTDSDDAKPQSAETESAPIPAPVSEPDENQRVSGTASAESVPAPQNAETQSVTVSFWTLSPDAAPALERYPVSKETASGLWYALTPEQFDALRETLPESAFTAMDAASLSGDDAPPLRDRAPVYLFLPRPD